MSGSQLIHLSTGPFVVREQISSGGVAEVHRAQHRETARDFAIKVMRVERMEEPAQRKAFQDEYAFLERLDHPAIPKVRRQDAINGRPCMVMDLIPGRTLQQLRAEGSPFNPLDAFLQLVDVVAYCHGAGIIHNDLKLENVLLRPDGRLGLVDFGNARNDGSRTGLFRKIFGRQEPVFGSPTYVAPEVISREGSPTTRSDVYSLGVCCFILLTNEPPFVYDSVSARLRAAVKAVAPSIRQRRPALPVPFARIIDNCLAKDPSQRPADAVVLLASLRAVTSATGMVAAASGEASLPSICDPKGPDGSDGKTQARYRFCRPFDH